MPYIESPCTSAGNVTAPVSNKIEGLPNQPWCRCVLRVNSFSGEIGQLIPNVCPQLLSLTLDFLTCSQPKIRLQQEYLV